MPQPEPLLILGMIPLPSPTVALRFAETELPERVVRHLLLAGAGFFNEQAVLVTSGKSHRLYTSDMPWAAVKEIMRKDQYV